MADFAITCVARSKDGCLTNWTILWGMPAGQSPSPRCDWGDASVPARSFTDRVAQNRWHLKVAEGYDEAEDEMWMDVNRW